VVGGLLVVGVVALSAPGAEASTLSVTTCKDSGAGSLPQVMVEATSGSTVTFELSPSCSLITLADTIHIATNVTIEGPGASALALNESIYKTVIDVASTVTSATISGLTIENGSTGIDNSGNLSLNASTILDNGSDAGGGIVNSGTLAVTDSTLSSNSVDTPDVGGGGIENAHGTVSVTGSTFSENTAVGGAGGGAIYNDAGSVNITDSTLSGNSASDGSGGGIDNDGGEFTVSGSTLADNSAVNGTGGGIENASGTVTVDDSTVSRDNAYYSFGGGGLFNSATATISNSTFDADSATYNGEGGGIYNGGTLSITNSTLAHNIGSVGGGIYGPAAVSATILATNTQGGNCSQSVTDGGYNLDDDGSCGFTASTDLSDTPAGLDPQGLADNGGPTGTVALEAVSPAIGAIGSASLCSSPDQRGVLRPTPCDVGSVQLALPPQAITSPDSKTAAVGSSFSFTVTTSGVPAPSITKTGRLPTHVTFVDGHNGTATISGTPAKTGVYRLMLKAFFGKRGRTSSIQTQDFTLTVAKK
jgi:hypothetical protein